jgi:hypothetical protein
MTTQKFDDIELIRQRLSNAEAGRKRSGSIASLVELMRNDVAAHRERGLTWKAIAFAMMRDEAKQAAIRSAYQRLPSEEPDQAAETAPRKERTKPKSPPPNQEAQAPPVQEQQEPQDPSAERRRFSFEPITDTYGPDNK